MEGEGGVGGDNDDESVPGLQPRGDSTNERSDCEDEDAMECGMSDTDNESEIGGSSRRVPADTVNEVDDDEDICSDMPDAHGRHGTLKGWASSDTSETDNESAIGARKRREPPVETVTEDDDDEKTRKYVKMMA